MTKLKLINTTGVAKLMLALCMTCLVPVLAQAQSLSIKCQSEDEGNLAVKLRPQYNPTSRTIYFSGDVGTMRNGEVKVSAYVSAKYKRDRFDYELVEIFVTPNDGVTLAAGASRIMSQLQRSFSLTVAGPGIDPEGIQCDIFPKLSN